MTRAHSFFAVAAVAAITTLGLGLALDLARDPYGMFAGAEQVTPKPAVYRRVKLAKSFDITRRKPSAIVLGTSRSHIAFRMDHPGWSGPPASRYNAAFDGATPKEMYGFLRHATAAGNLKQVVLGLDAWQLNEAPSFTRPDFDPDLLLRDAGMAERLRVFARRLAIMGSIDTTLESLRDLFAADQPAAWLAPDGQRRGDVFFHDVEPDFAASPASYLWAIDRQEIGYALDEGPRRPASAPVTTDRSNLEYIHDIIEWCYAHDIDLRIVLTPAHAHQLEIIARLGGWRGLELGKEKLVALAEAGARAHERAPYPIFDFSIYSPITDERVPPGGSTTELQNYWDSSHFKQAVGDRVLDAVFGREPLDDSIGHLLHAADMKAWEQTVRTRQSEYRAQHADELTNIDRMIRETQQSAG